MKKFILCILCIIALILQSQWTFAGCNAGTLLYFKFQDDIYLLLADHNSNMQGQRGWSGFGGRCGGDDPDKAAARETEEETGGFYEQAKILDKLRKSSSIKVNDFTTFFVEVEPVPAVLLNSHKKTTQEADYTERGPYAWIPLSEIWRAIENRKSGKANIDKKYLPTNAHTDWLFEYFVNGLDQAKSAGVFP